MVNVMFGSSFGGPEMIVVFVVILIFFGPRRLPEIAKMVGKTMETLRKSAQDFKGEVMRIEPDPDLSVSNPSPDSMSMKEQGYIDTQEVPDPEVPAEQELADVMERTSDGAPVQAEQANLEPEKSTDDRAG
jgi:sec-independent protein translocase protein TatA